MKNQADSSNHVDLLFATEQFATIDRNDLSNTTGGDAAGDVYNAIKHSPAVQRLSQDGQDVGGRLETTGRDLKNGNIGGAIKNGVGTLIDGAKLFGDVFFPHL
jgi:hypothetical protein